MSAEWPVVSLGELIRLERRPVEVIADQQYREIGIYCFGRGIFHKVPRTGLEVGDKNLYELREGDLILQVTFAWEGAIALCGSAEAGLYGSTRYPTFRVNEDRCFAPYVAKYLCTPNGLDQISKICPGSAGRNRVLSIKRIPEIRIPLEPFKPPDGHLFAAALKGKAASLRRLTGAMTSISDDMLREYRKALPTNWGSAGQVIDEALEHLRKVRDNMDAFTAEVYKVLA